MQICSILNKLSWMFKATVYKLFVNLIKREGLIVFENNVPNISSDCGVDTYSFIKNNLIISQCSYFIKINWRRYIILLKLRLILHTYIEYTKNLEFNSHWYYCINNPLYKITDLNFLNYMEDKFFNLPSDVILLILPRNRLCYWSPL